MSRFLLASDDARTRIGVAGALERAGHGVDRVTHVRLAALHADLHPIDAVVVGLQQPLRRQHFIETIRARDERVPVIVLLDSYAAWQRAQLEGLGVTTVMAPWPWPTW